MAERAGVSTTTVSLFVSGRESVCSPETAERIRGAVSTLNYTPNSLTRGLRKGELTTIGVCLPNPLDYDLEFGSLYFEQLWRGIMLQADRENYSLLHYPYAVRESQAHDAFLDGRVDGILLHDHNNRRAAHLCKAGMPTVLLNRVLDLPDGCGAAYANEANTADLVLSYLWQMGHRRIAHVAGPVGERARGAETPKVTTALPSADDVSVGRLEAYCDWMIKRNAFDPDLIAYAQAWSAPQALLILQRWLALEKPPTAIFCANDAQAVDIITAAQSIGLHIPRDISITGVDDSQTARDHVPSITSVKVPVDEIGQQGVRALLRMFRGAPVDESRVAVPVTNIVVRDSTAPPE
ncbi:MAG TPA: LacI family DNA-binding transcriptional regulator [Capsulimonadaceae bacterium]|nr:LacI family DNA-binding transcriptional regulator [Capsulimonadaceae bacterium]